jgi:hypothetical protein
MRRIPISLSIVFMLSGLLFSQEIGKAAPAFTHTTSDNYTINLSDYRGKVVYLFFFGWN